MEEVTIMSLQKYIILAVIFFSFGIVILHSGLNRTQSNHAMPHSMHQSMNGQSFLIESLT